jgi:hypothetical protein
LIWFVDEVSHVDLSITRTPAVLRLDNKSKNCIGSRLAPLFRSRSVFQAPHFGVTPVVWDGKSSGHFDICKWLLKNFFRTPLLHPLYTPLPRRFKERFSESGCKCREPFHICKHWGKNFFMQPPQGVPTATGNTLPLKSLCPFRTNPAT